MRYWRTPKEIYASLDAEFHFDFDPCPYPPTLFNGLEVDWGQMNYVNPPFRPSDGRDKMGPTAFARKAILEAQKGRASFLTLPIQSYANLLLEAGAVPRSMGRIQWLEVETGAPMPSPSPICGFYLAACIPLKEMMER